MKESEENFDHIKTEKLGAGGAISFGYRNFDEMMAHMRKAEEAAIARMLPEQAAMIDCAEDQWYVNLSVNPKELFVCGEAWSVEHAERNELESYGVKSIDELDDEKKREFQASNAMFRDSRRRGYIFGNAFSTAEPRGELGSTHVASMWPITEAAFNEAKEQKWQPDMEDNRKSQNLRTAMFTLWVKYRLGR